MVGIIPESFPPNKHVELNLRVSVDMGRVQL